MHPMLYEDWPGSRWTAGLSATLRAAWRRAGQVHPGALASGVGCPPRPLTTAISGRRG